MGGQGHQDATPITFRVIAYSGAGASRRPAPPPHPRRLLGGKSSLVSSLTCRDLERAALDLLLQHLSLSSAGSPGGDRDCVLVFARSLNGSQLDASIRYFGQAGSPATSLATEILTEVLIERLALDGIEAATGAPRAELTDNRAGSPGRPRASSAGATRSDL